MTLRRMAWWVLMVAAGIVSAGVTLNGIYNALRVDFRQDSVLTGAHCLLPILCFPVFLLVRPARRAALLLLITAGGFLAAYSALNWRTCAELGYCTSVISTVLQTLKTRWALAFFAVAAISFIAAAIDDHAPSLKPKNRMR